MRKIIFWTACFIVGLVVGYLTFEWQGGGASGEVVGLADDASEPATITVDLVIDRGEGTALVYPDLVVEKGESALGLLKKIARQEGFAVKITETTMGDFINSIGDLEGDSQNFWAFLINGQMAQVGAGEYRLENGDEVKFAWTKL